MTETSIRVAVRVRPLLEEEIARDWRSCVRVFNNQIVLGGERTFAFDHVFDEAQGHDAVFTAMGAPLVESFVDGINTCIIAYGQTSAGKTFTIEGFADRAVKSIFSLLPSMSADHDDTAVSSLDLVPQNSAAPNNGSSSTPFFRGKVSFVELYNDQFLDLLDIDAMKPTITLREDREQGLIVSNIHEESVVAPHEVLKWMKSGAENRSTACTLLNHAGSSRSHAIFTLTLEFRGARSKFNFVDLAGSERLTKAHGNAPSTGRLRETISINSGLLQLGNVITALCEKKAYVPFRSSKLTRLLQDSLSGNSLTSIISCISCADANFEESLNTLKYACRAKAIRTKPIANLTAGLSAAEAEIVLQLRVELSRAYALLQQRGIDLPATAIAATRSCVGGSDFATSTGVISASTSLHDGSIASANQYDAMLQNVRNELMAERRMTERLESDLFKAECSAMEEHERRTALEREIQELRLALQQTAAASLSRPQSSSIRTAGSATPLSAAHHHDPNASNFTAATAATTAAAAGTSVMSQTLTPSRSAAISRNEMQRLRDMERERDELLKEKLRVEDELKTISNNRPPEDALRQLEASIEAKQSQIAALERKDEIRRHTLEERETKLNSVETEKHRLQAELARAEDLVERAHIESSQKERQRQLLKQAFESKLRAAEASVQEYMKRKREADLLAKHALGERERIRKGKEEIAALKMQHHAAQQELSATEGRLQKMRVAHQAELQTLHRHVRELESRNIQLTALVQHKEIEVQKQRQLVNNTPGSSGQPPGSARVPAASGVGESPSVLATVGGVGGFAPPRARVALTSAATPSRLNRELADLQGIEKDLAAALQQREKTTAALDELRRSTELKRKRKALEGWTYRLQTVEANLEKTSDSENPHSFSQEKQRLWEQRTTAISQIQQIEKALPEMEEIITSLGDECTELDERIDSLRAAKEFRLKRVRAVKSTSQVAGGGGGGGASPRPMGLMAGATFAKLAGGPTAVEVPSAAEGNEKALSDRVAQLEALVKQQRETIAAFSATSSGGVRGQEVRVLAEMGNVSGSARGEVGQQKSAVKNPKTIGVASASTK